MKILEQTPDRLVLRHRPFATWLGCGVAVVGAFLVPTVNDQMIWLIRLGLLVFGVVFLVIEGAIVTNIFDKEQQRWILKHEGLTGTQQQTYALSDIAAIEVKETYYKGFHYEIFVYLKDGSKIRLHKGKLSSKSDAMKAAEAIADFRQLGPVNFIKAPGWFLFR